MAERWTFLPASEVTRLRLEVQCHGKTTTVELNYSEAIKNKHVIVSFARSTFNTVNVVGAPRGITSRG